MRIEAIDPSWRPALAPVLAGEGMAALDAFLAAEAAAGKTILPQPRDRFRALELTPLDAVKVVILGQDPYHGPGQAHGLSFSVQPGVKVPPSPVVFLLWGAHAQKKAAFVRSIEQGGHHLVLRSPHPSPLSAHTGWFGSKPFSQANAFLTAHGRAPVDWTLPAA